MSEPPPDTRKCAVCGKPQNPSFHPFCSKRCADIDLGRWLNEGYSIPGGETQDRESTGEDDEA